MLVRPKLRVLYISLICKSPMRSVLLWPSLYRWGNWALERLLLSQSRVDNKWESGSSDSELVLNHDTFAGGSKQNWRGRGGQCSHMSGRVKVTQAIKEGLCRGEMGEGAGTWDRGLNAKGLDGEYVESPLPPATNVGRELPLYYRGRGGPRSWREKDPTIQVLMTPYPHPPGNAARWLLHGSIDLGQVHSPLLISAASSIVWASPLLLYLMGFT